MFSSVSTALMSWTNVAFCRPRYRLGLAASMFSSSVLMLPKMPPSMPAHTQSTGSASIWQAGCFDVLRQTFPAIAGRPWYRGRAASMFSSSC